MKKSTFIRGLAPLAAGALLLSTAARAQTSFTATGWVNAVLAPGIVSADALGQVSLHGTVHTARVESPDPRIAGQAFIIGNGSFNADGTANVQGPVYLQVGTWDAAGTNFTPNGALWDMTWRGVLQTNNSMVLNVAGYGVGGSIDGLRVETTLTRGPASGPIDTNVPYLYAGAIKPPPVNTNLVVDNFDNNHFAGQTWGNGTAAESNGQFNAIGLFAGVHTTSFLDSFIFGGAGQAIAFAWNVPDGMTREWRADLVSLDENATNLAILYVGNTSGGYGFHQGRDSSDLWKWSSGNAFSILACQRVTVRTTNVVLALALTRRSTNLVVTARVLDKADPTTVLGPPLTFVDTPAVDPTLTSAQVQALTGMHLVDVHPDSAGAPFMSSLGAALGVFQYTDGTRPAPKATFDNLEMRTSEIPPVGFERAVRLSWPASATINFAAEGAPTVQGPWLPVQNLTLPGMNQMTVPASDVMGFFRLVQAP